MEAFAQLALMAKAQRVFESEGTFLSFPVLQPLTYPPDRLRFADTTTAADLARLSEFSRIVNTLPRGVVAPVSTEEYLWDVYADALRSGRPATGTMSAEASARWSAARAFLYADPEASPPPDSAAYTAYKACRDQVVVREEDYRNQKLTAEASADAAVRDQWAMDEPRLRAEIAALRDRWATDGSKAAVESALALEASAAAESPAPAWNDWRASFIDAIDAQTGLDLIEFAPTGLAPYDVFDRGEWPSFTLTRAEMESLARQAPAALTGIFGADAAPGDVESLTFEYRSVALTRSWLRPQLFRSRAWRLGAAGGELSDGATPPSGRCPAYVSALVLARRVVVHRRPAAGATTTEPQRVETLTSLDPSILTRLRATAIALPPGVLHAVPAAPVVNPVDPAPAATPTVLTARASLGAGAFGQVLPERMVVRPRAVVPNPRPVATVAAGPAPAAPAAAPAAGGPAGSAAGDDITILAFVCKRIGRCPDPDPALAWS